MREKGIFKIRRGREYGMVVLVILAGLIAAGIGFLVMKKFYDKL